MNIEVRVADKNDMEKWDEIVEASPHGTIFHTWEWLKIMEKYTKSKLYPIIGFKGSTLIGAFPLFYQRKSFIKMVFSPPPHTAVPYLGPVFVDYDQLKQSKKESVFIEFQEHINKFIFYKIKANYISLTSPLDLLDSRPFKWTGYCVEPLYNYRIDLTNGKNYVWKQFNKKLRGNIKRTSKRDFSVEEGSKRELGFLYDSNVKRYKEQGKVFSMDKEYLTELYESFYPQNLRIFVVKYVDKPLGGLVAIAYKNTIFFWIGTTKISMRGDSPNDLLQWKVIEWACEQGFRYYEEIGANTPRLCKFKSKYNPDLKIYFAAQKYSPFFIKWFKTAYKEILKPMYAKLSLS